MASVFVSIVIYSFPQISRLALIFIKTLTDTSLFQGTSSQRFIRLVQFKAFKTGRIILTYRFPLNVFLGSDTSGCLETKCTIVYYQ